MSLATSSLVRPSLTRRVMKNPDNSRPLKACTGKIATSKLTRRVGIEQKQTSTVITIRIPKLQTQLAPVWGCVFLRASSLRNSRIKKMFRCPAADRFAF